MIKNQTKNRTVYELYDIFCEAYENMLSEAIATSRAIIQENSGSIEDAISELSLFMSINAGTTQLIAGNGLKLLGEEDETEK